MLHTKWLAVALRNGLAASDCVNTDIIVMGFW